MTSSVEAAGALLGVWGVEAELAPDEPVVEAGVEGACGALGAGTEGAGAGLL